MLTQLVLNQHKGRARLVAAGTASARRRYTRPVDLDVVFLGTSGSAPTAQRATSATLVRRGGDKLLIDCGEGTQRQLLRSDVGLADLEDIFLTHFHADHYLGLPGMLKSFALRGRELPLRLHGPPGLRDLLAALRRVFGSLTYPIETVELEPGDAIDRGDYEIRAFAVDHGAAGGRLPDRRGRPSRALRRRRRRRARRSAREGARPAAARGGRRARERRDRARPSRCSAPPARAARSP